MKLFTPGNDKVGDGVLVWNIPVVKTCPGSTLFCRSYCYGDWGGNRWPVTRERHEANYQASLSPDFPARAVAELRTERRRSRDNLCRVHSVGDFYGADYIRKWVEIATAAPEWTFWAYTRSWRVAHLLPELERLAVLPNFYLWLSADFMSKLPPQLPWARGVAWMQAVGENLDWMKARRWSVDELLIFPVKAEDRQPVKRVGLGLIYPHYNGTPEDKVAPCDGCGFCFTAVRSLT